jgi:hypothetical protein
VGKCNGKRHVPTCFVIPLLTLDSLFGHPIVIGVKNDKSAEGRLLSPGKLLDPLRIDQMKLAKQETLGCAC